MGHIIDTMLGRAIAVGRAAAVTSAAIGVPLLGEMEFNDLRGRAPIGVKTKS